MDEILSAADVEQQYFKNIVMYKEGPVYIDRTTAEVVRYVNLLTGRQAEAPFSRKDFTACRTRIGMVNTCKSVIYVSRIPIRKMGIGHNAGNMRFPDMPVAYPSGSDETKQHLLTFKTKEMGEAILNKYPPLEVAVEMIDKKNCYAVAFDKQFCLAKEKDAASHKKLIYKTKFVGNYVDGKLVFTEGNEHLELLIGDKYEQYL